MSKTIANAGANAGPRPIYLDYQATTPTDPRVVEAMLPYFTERFGNPHSSEHAYGWEAEEAVERAREEVADLIGAEPREIIFTSGATEANNLAIKGALAFRSDRPHLVTLASEHKCVLEAARSLEKTGVRVTILGVRPDGLVDLDSLAKAVTEETALVSVMAANNEIGVLQPLKEIAAIAHAKGAWFHSDGAQAAGKVPLDVRQLDLDLLSLSAHKLYGPKGIGALFVRRRPRIRLVPLIDGGGQERGLRSGTLPTPLVVGFGKAAALAKAEMAEEVGRLLALRQHLWLGLKALGAQLNGDPDKRLPGNLSITFPGYSADELIKALPGLALSTGSACTSSEVEPSHVLKALGLDKAAAGGSLRIGLGRWSSQNDVDQALSQIAQALERLAAKPGNG